MQMFSPISCCCDPHILGSNVLRIIERRGKDMKEFKYNNNIYVIDSDITIEEVIKIYDENDKKIDYIKDEGNYVARKQYAVRKGYTDIEVFDTEDDANNFVNRILEEIEEKGD